MTIQNTSDTTYTLSLQAVRPVGSQNSPLWQSGSDALLMGVWDTTGPPPASFPTLFSWTTQFWPLTSLAPGQTVQYEIELFLPTTAGNADQNKTATITFEWQAG